LQIEVSSSYDTNHPYVGEEFTKYNTGDWISGEVVKGNFKGDFGEMILKDLWEGFDNLHFYTGEGEANQLTGKGAWHTTAYAVGWELMDSVAKEVNKLRRQNGLYEFNIDNSMCFVHVGADNPKVNSVFDNAVCNLENNTASHTYNRKSQMAECMASGILNAEDNSTETIAAAIAGRWYDSRKGHKDIIMSKKYKTMGILILITDTGTGDAYAVFK
jgi:hypothetical protein